MDTLIVAEQLMLPLGVGVRCLRCDSVGNVYYFAGRGRVRRQAGRLPGLPRHRLGWRGNVGNPDMTSDYDTDILTWSERQADLLRRVGAGEAVNADLDWHNLAEEIGDLGKSLRRDLHNRITTILEHLLKLEASPAHDPRGTWRVTVLEQRDAVDDILRDAPSLNPTVAEVIETRIPRARRRAHAALVDYGEVSKVDIDTRIYSVDQVLGDWFPG